MKDTMEKSKIELQDFGLIVGPSKEKWSDGFRMRELLTYCRENHIKPCNLSTKELNSFRTI